MACGQQVVYGESSVIPCGEGIPGVDEQTTAKDGDPTLRLEAGTLTLRDDEAGRHGVFTLRGPVR